MRATIERDGSHFVERALLVVCGRNRGDAAGTAETILDYADDLDRDGDHAAAAKLRHAGCARSDADRIVRDKARIPGVGVMFGTWSEMTARQVARDLCADSDRRRRRPDPDRIGDPDAGATAALHPRRPRRDHGAVGAEPQALHVPVRRATDR